MLLGCRDSVPDAEATLLPLQPVERQAESGPGSGGQGDRVESRQTLTRAEI